MLGFILGKACPFPSTGPMIVQYTCCRDYFAPFDTFITRNRKRPAGFDPSGNVVLSDFLRQSDDRLDNGRAAWAFGGLWHFRSRRTIWWWTRGRRIRRWICRDGVLRRCRRSILLRTLCSCGREGR